MFLKIENMVLSLHNPFIMPFKKKTYKLNLYHWILESEGVGFFVFSLLSLLMKINLDII